MKAYSESTRAIIETVRRIPYGHVASYGAVAHAAGYPNGARQVVRVLSTLSSSEGLPWHRVVNKKGEIALTGEGECEQIALLQSEGVSFVAEGKVAPKYFYDFR